MFRVTLPLGRVADVPIRLHPSVLLIFVLITYLLGTSVLPQSAPGTGAVAYWTVAATTSVFFLASLLAHELAHALVAKRNGVRVRRVTLWLLGGVAELTHDPATPGAEFRISVAGPLTSLAVSIAGFGLAALLAGSDDSLVLAATVWVASMNAVIAVFNLLPGAPLDGGRILHAYLWRRSGDRERSAQRAGEAGGVLGTVLLALGLFQLLMGYLGGIWLMLLGWFLGTAAMAERRFAVLRRDLAGTTVGDAMSRTPVIAPGWWTVRAFLDRTAADSPHRVFPVLSVDGRLLGTVSLADLARVGPADRETTAIAAVCRPLEEEDTVESREPLAKVALRALATPGRGLIAVVDNGTLTGVLTADDVRRAAERTALGLHGRQAG